MKTGGYFQKQGRSLLANGYLIVPIQPGQKRPALANWQRSRIGAVDLQSYPKCGVGVLCGQGANPIAAFDIDSSDPELVRRFAAWCQDVLGVTCERVGNAPKILLPYRAEQDGWGKISSAWFEDVFGDTHRLEVLGYGQQFVAYHTHPDTGKPYEWVDLLGGIEEVRVDELPVVTLDQVREAIRVFEALAKECGAIARGNGGGSAIPNAPKERTPAADDDFFGRVNEAAMEALDHWVPVLFPSAREYRGGYRVTSVDLGRDLEEDLGIHPTGIKDHGLADMGDEREGRRTPIDLVLEWSPVMSDDPLWAPLTPFEAATWLCEQLNVPREQLGFGLRRQKEKDAERSARRIEQRALVEKIKACDDSIDLLGDVASHARALIGNIPALRGEIAAEIKTRYRELTGFALTVGELAKALREPVQPTVMSKRPLTEFGNAERMLDRYSKGLMFVPEFGMWYAWTGVYWRAVSEVEIEHYAKETIKALVTEVEHHDPSEFYKFCTMSQQAKMVRNIMSLAASDPRVVVPVRALDKHWYYLGVQNGIVDLRTGELMNPDPDLFITKVCACNYVPGAKGELFRKAVSDALKDDANYMDYLQRLIGYAATGNPTEDVMAIPFGNGANGKSTIFGAIREAFGSYGAAADPATFVTDGKGGGSAGGAREDLVRLRGVRFLYVNEPDDGGELREGSVKSMAGGDAITARGLYSKASVEFMPTWLTVMPTNHKPVVKSTDDGIWRRLHMLPFHRNMSTDPTIVKDPTFKNRVRADLEGVLAWIIEGALNYQKNGLKKAGAVAHESEQYRTDMDLLAEWIETCCDVGPHYRASVESLWKSWESFAKERGLLNYVKNSNLLGRRLEQKYPAEKVKGVRSRIGLQLRDYGDLF